ncbi:MAG: aminoacyl--tRNA ligase-related protein [Candidatus Paceibacterota bacterium]
MRQSKLFIKTVREDPKDEESLNAKLLIRAGYVYKVMAGVYAFLPLGLKVIKNIEDIIRKKMIAMGGNEVLLSALQNRSDWEVSGRWDSFDVLFKFASFYSKNDYVLGPTHEEEIVLIMRQQIASYRNLPAYFFQFQNKFRDEKRAKSGLLRGREFIMKDFYSFHASEKDLDSYYDSMKDAYSEIFNELGIGNTTYLTLASGGTFSKYSHEFQTLTPAGEDTIHICDSCKAAVNEEVFEDESLRQEFAKEGPVCPSCGKKDLRKEKAIEVGNIFKIKDKFSSPFGLKFKDENGEEHNVMMGCYGIGINRLLGAIVEVSHDDKGIIWPESVAPFKFHLIESRKGEGEKIYNSLVADGFKVLYDDRDIGLGEKFADADLVGIPWRLVVSARTEGKIEVKKRNEEKTELFNYENIRKF